MSRVVVNNIKALKQVLFPKGGGNMVVFIANRVYVRTLKEELGGEDCNNLSKFQTE